jgi:16S rRNA processing protein RimM
MALVGRIARAHGNRGQVIVNPETDFPDDRFQAGAELFVEDGGAVRALRVVAMRMQRDRPVVAFDGIATMNDAEALAGRELRVPVDRLAALPHDTFYHHDLVGCRVETLAGADVGVVSRVESGGGVSRLIVVRGAGAPGVENTAHGDVEIPLVAEICMTIDVGAKRIVVDPPKGLIEVNWAL